MSDPINQLDPISTLQSSIVRQQLFDLAQKSALAIVSLLAIFGVTIGPEQTALITALIVSLVGIGVSGWTLYSRIKHPCPPIVPKSQLNNGAPQ